MQHRTLGSVAVAALVSALLPAQAAWNVLTPAGPSAPPGLTSAGSATDGGNYYLFGGRIASPQVATPHLIDEFWRFDGNAWSRIQGAGPGNREKALLVWDTARQRIVLFGGQDLNGAALGDTWEWTPGGGWTLLAPAVAPTPRYWAAMEYDPIAGRTLLFGGMDGTSFFGDTWSWDGTTWTQRAPANSPSARGRHQMSFDLRRGRIVLFGGTNNNPNPIGGDTWIWDGADWSQVQTTTAPYGNGCVSGGMAYDPIRDRIVLVGGYNGSYRDGTWEFDGTDWADRGSFAVMPGRGGPAVTFVPAFARTICYGGFNSTGGGAFPWNTFFPSIDSQLYGYQTDALASFSEFPSAAGCATSAGTPPSLVAASPPWAGTTMALEVRNIPVGAPTWVLIGFSPSSVGLGAIGAPGCTLHVAGPTAFPTATTGSVATLPLFLPADPALHGGTFHAQALVLDTAANQLGLVLSARGDATIGAL